MQLLSRAPQGVTFTAVAALSFLPPRLARVQVTWAARGVRWRARGNKDRRPAGARGPGSRFGELCVYRVVALENVREEGLRPQGEGTCDTSGDVTECPTGGDVLLRLSGCRPTAPSARTRAWCRR